MAISVDWAVVRWYLEGMYGEVEEGIDEEGKPAFTVSIPVLIYLFIYFYFSI